MKTLAYETLKIEEECGFEVSDECYDTLEAIISRAEEKIDVQADPEKILQGINEILEEFDFTYEENGLFSHGLEKREIKDEMKRGIDCKHFSLLYYAIGEVLGLPLHMVNAPGHVFIRWDDGKVRFNWETTSATAHDDEHYVEWLNIHEKSILNDVYLRNLKREQAKAKAFCTCGTVKSEKRDFDSAIADFNRAIELNPNDVTSYINRGLAKCRKRDFDSAIADFDEAIERDPNDSTFYINRGYAKKDKGDLDGAVADIDIAIELDPSGRSGPLKKTYYQIRAEIKEKKEDLDGAVADYTSAIEIEVEPHKKSKLHYECSLIKEKKEDLDGAIADLDRAIELNPGLVYYVKRGKLRKEKGDYDEAVADLTKAIELGEDLEYEVNWFYVDLIVAKKEKGDYDGAMADLDKAIELDPHNATFHSISAEIKEKKGDLDGAIDDCTWALKLRPLHETYPIIYMTRGNAKRRKGDFEGAIADYDIATEYKLSREDAEKAYQETIKELFSSLDKAIKSTTSNSRLHIDRVRAKIKYFGLWNTIKDTAKAVIYS